jgi:uncharacterized protein (DUF2384 family)
MGFGRREDDRTELGKRAANHLRAQQIEEFRRKVVREASLTRQREREQALRDEEEEKRAAKRAKVAQAAVKREEDRQEKARKKALIRSRPGTPAKAYKTPGKRPNSKGFFS